RGRTSETVVFLALPLPGPAPSDARAATARRPEVVVTEVSLIDCSRAPEVASVDDDQSGLIESPAILAVPSGSPAKRWGGKAGRHSHSAHFVPTIVFPRQAGSNESAFCMDDSNWMQRLNVEGGSGLFDETCNSWVGIGA